MNTNYVLIDFENVQPQQLACLKGKPVKIKVFVGPTQTKIPVEIALCLQSFGYDAEYIKIESSGPNALDFHIAFYVGELIAGDSSGYFHIISKDTGFDPLIRHLKSRKISIQRYPDISEVSLVKLSHLRTIEEKIALVLEKLSKQKVNRPATSKTLRSSLNTLFLKQLSEQELTQLLDELVKRKFIAINEEKVSYQIPEGASSSIKTSK